MKKTFLISQKFLDNFASYDPVTKMYTLIGDRFQLVDVDGKCTIKISIDSGCSCDGCKKEEAETKIWEG